MKVVIIENSIAQVKEIPTSEFVKLQKECEEKASAKEQAEKEKEKVLNENLVYIYDNLKDLHNYNDSLLKANFINVFTLFELKALKGEIEVEDESLLDLDTKVLNNEISVYDAINRHEFLKDTFGKLYGGK